jgi:protocatechuate 3,4-dioxygenase beta subunit
VTKNGRGVVGAHIVAFSPATGVLVGNFSADSNGAFTIASLAPGPYIIRVEPMDDAELESFFDDSVIPTVDLDFRVTYHTGLVVVPPGGGASPIEVRVVAK